MTAIIALIIIAFVGFLVREQYQRQRYRRLLRQVRAWLDEHGQEWNTSEQVAYILGNIRDLDRQGRD